MRTYARLLLAVVLVVWCFPIPLAQAQTHPQVHEIALIEGTGHLLQFQKDIQKVVIAEPKIADAIVISPREVMVNAKGPGHTTLLIWEEGGDPSQYQIAVSKDDSEWDAFRKQMLDSVVGSTLSVTGSGETIVLAGMVKSSDDVKRLQSIAQTRAKTVINLLKAPPPPEPRQILLQVKFADIDRVALTQVGFNLFSLNPKFQGATSTQQFTPPKFSQVQTTGGTSNTNSVNFSDLLNLFVFRPDLNIGATIQALQQRNLLQILAEPNLLCLEGKDASFLAGGSFPFPTITTTPTGGSTAPVITVQFKPFGVKLDFTPTVTPNGEIDLKVAPEVSSLDYTNAVTLDGFTIPALSQRRAETEVVLHDGESFAIAGMINNQVLETIEKVPGLGSLPVLGRLFQSRSTQKSTDELLVVITPRFVKPLSPEERAKLPDMPSAFLPTVPEENAKKKGKKNTTPPTPPPAATGTASDKPEFVGPSGQIIPKQQQ
jgi:pilus assembly protein CpaC